METRHTKQVKVLGKFRASRARTEFFKGSHKIVPWLTVNGLWLENLGFKVGAKVNITGDKGRIIVELADDLSGV